MILRIRSPEPRHLHSISSGGAGRNEWRDAQPIRARRVCDNSDRFATPVPVGPIHPVALTAIRISNRQHDVDAQLPNRDNRDVTRSQVEKTLMMAGWSNCAADHAAGLDSDGSRAARVNGNS